MKMKTEIRDILRKVEKGEISADEALLKIKKQPFEDLGLSLIHI